MNARVINKSMANSTDTADTANTPGTSGQIYPGTFSAKVISRKELFTGPIFKVERLNVQLKGIAGTADDPVTIQRDLITHSPCVVMLVHDVPGDRYLLQYEYRVGADRFVPGIPAGFIDEGESPEEAMLREIREEAGIIPAEASGSAASYSIDHAGAFYSSEGMTNELAHIAVIHLYQWEQCEQQLDAQEYIRGAWVDWDTLLGSGITASNSTIAVQHEMIRRLKMKIK